MSLHITLYTYLIIFAHALSDKSFGFGFNNNSMQNDNTQQAFFRSSRYLTHKTISTHHPLSSCFSKTGTLKQDYNLNALRIGQRYALVFASASGRAYQHSQQCSAHYSKLSSLLLHSVKLCIIRPYLIVNSLRSGQPTSETTSPVASQLALTSQQDTIHLLQLLSTQDAI